MASHSFFFFFFPPYVWQVLRYHPGQAYVAHTDYFPPKRPVAEGVAADVAKAGRYNWDSQYGGGNRFATVPVIYTAE